MHRGYVKLWRKVSDNPLWLEEKFTRGQAWIDLVMLANHKDGHIRVRGIKVDVPRGFCGWSILKLSGRWGWSRGKVQRFLNELETVQQIVQQKNRITSLIKIINYSEYQGNGTTKQTTDGTTDGQQTDTNKNDKNEKNIIPHKKILSLYHEILPEGVKHKSWDGNRQTNLRCRWTDAVESNGGKLSNTLEFWEGFFKYIRSSDFLMGRVEPQPGHKVFRIGLEWIVKKENFNKIIEGQYHGR